MLNCIVAPPDKPQVFRPPLGDVTHPLAGELLNAVRQRGPAPVSMWNVINKLTDAQRPNSRSQRRCWRLRYLGAVRALQAAGLLHRHVGLIAREDFAFRPRRRSPKRLPLPVALSASQKSGSDSLVAVVEKASKGRQTVGRELSSGNEEELACAAEPKSAARPVSEIVREAASRLARLPRDAKRWSGWIGPTRSYCGMPIQLSTGESVFVFGALRRRVIWSRQPGVLTDGVDGAGVHWGVLPAKVVEITRNPNAVLLGSRKRGAREIKSEAKARAARLNGTRPCAPGKKRGRPSHPQSNRHSSPSHLNLSPFSR